MKSVLPIITCKNRWNGLKVIQGGRFLEIPRLLPEDRVCKNVDDPSGFSQLPESIGVLQVRISSMEHKLFNSVFGLKSPLGAFSPKSDPRPKFMSFG
jgi:hypothetical protein